MLTDSDVLTLWLWLIDDDVERYSVLLRLWVMLVVGDALVVTVRQVDSQRDQLLLLAAEA